MNKNSIISGFQIQLPKHHLKQSLILEWMKTAHRKSEDLAPTCPTEFPLERFIDRYAVKDNLIEERYFECDDLHINNWERNNIYRLVKDSPKGSAIDERHSFYQERATQVLDQLYPSAAEVPAHLIHVTCTGYMAPSAAQVLISQRNWVETAVTHAYHMGCYAAIPAVRMAWAFSLQSQKSIDIVHTEMCSLHMNPSSHTPEQIVVQTLFADGHIKYQIKEDAPGEKGLEIISIKEKIVSESTEDMTWHPSSWGMQMSLSKEVPAKLKNIIGQFYTDLVRDARLDPDELLSSAIFAVHPGGPKIIEAIQEELSLSLEQISASKKVLKHRGNMSSATLPHIWYEILSVGPKSGQYVVSFAFGPGLTIFGALFRVKA